MAVTVALVVRQLVDQTLLAERAELVALHPVLPHTTQQITAETPFTVIQPAAVRRHQSMWPVIPVDLRPVGRQLVAPQTEAMPRLAQPRVVWP